MLLARKHTWLELHSCVLIDCARFRHPSASPSWYRATVASGRRPLDPVTRHHQYSEWSLYCSYIILIIALRVRGDRKEEEGRRRGLDSPQSQTFWLAICNCSSVSGCEMYEIYGSKRQMIVQCLPVACCMWMLYTPGTTGRLLSCRWST